MSAISGYYFENDGGNMDIWGNYYTKEQTEHIFLKKEEAEKYYAKKIELENFAKKEEIHNLKEEILKLKLELASYVKKSEFPSVLQAHAGNIMAYIEPHTNHRYCTNQLFHKIKHDLNVKLKKWIPKWQNV